MALVADHALATAMRWWVGQLIGLAPGWLARWLDGLLAWPEVGLDLSEGQPTLDRATPAGRQRLEACRLEPPWAETALRILPEWLERHRLRHRAPTLRLDAGSVLRRLVSLPRTPTRYLRIMLGQDIDRRTPFTAAQVCFDCQVVLRAGESDRMLVLLAAIERAQLRRLLTLTARAGLTPRRIGIAGEAAELDFLRDPAARDFLRDPAARPLGPTTRRPAGPALLAATLAAALCCSLVERGHRAEAALQDQLATARTSIARVAELRRQIEARRTRAMALPTQRAAISPGRVINEVARLLPDDSWLTELSIDSDFSKNGASVMISGNSARPTDLIGLLSASPIFANVRFTAPVTAQPGGGQHFSLGFEAKPE